MNNLFTFLVVFFFVSANIIFSADKITIIHVNDTHSNLTAGGERDVNLNGKLGGIARGASLIGAAKMADTNAIILHAGDMMIGDIFFNKYFGLSELGILKNLKFNAMTLGNHEFDLTAPQLDYILGTAKQMGIDIPMLSGNMVLLNDSLLNLKAIPKYITIPYGKYKVGVFGLTTPEANVISNALPDVFIDTNFVQIAGEITQTLKTVEKCDVVILLSHLGEYYDSFVASNIPGIDLIVGGHDHYSMTKPYMVKNPLGVEVPIVQSGAFWQSVGITTLSIDNSQVSLDSYNFMPLDESIPEYPDVKAIVDGMKAEIETTFKMSIFSEKLAECKEPFIEVADYANGKFKTPVGRLITEAFMEFGKTDIAMEPGGSTSQGLPKGPIVADDIFRMLGYGFNTDTALGGYRMCTFDIYGQALMGGLEIGAAQLDHNDEFLIQTSGMDYKVDITKPIGERVSDVYIKGNPIEMTKKYSVTTNEFVPMVLHSMDVPFENLDVKTGITEFIVLVNFVRGKVITEVPAGESNPLLSNILCSAYSQPNPCTHSLTMTFDATQTGEYTLIICDDAGKRIINHEIENITIGSNNYSINTQTLHNGTYFYRISKGNDIILGQFTVAK